jgi:hypothetical protein
MKLLCRTHKSPTADPKCLLELPPDMLLEVFL